jgi:hypothetical protein
MSSNTNKKLLFSTPLYSGVTENKEIINLSKDLFYNWRTNTIDQNGNNATGLMSHHWDLKTESNSVKDFDRFGITTFYEGSLTEKPEWDPVITHIITMVFNLLRNDYSGDICITNAWATLYPKDAYVPEHIHNNSLFSGVFYIKAPTNCGDIIFKDPAYISKTMASRLDNFPKYDILHVGNVQDGLMYLFPSWLPHYSQPNLTNEDRIIISFNVDFL